MKQIGIYLAAIFSMLFWSSAFVWTKVALEYYPPITIVFLRLLVASVLLHLFLCLIRNEEKIKSGHLKHFFLLAFFEPFCYFLGESFGMKYVSATVGAIIISTIPVFTPFFTYFFLNEKITKFGIIGLIVSFSGVILIVSQNSSIEASIKGILLLFFAVLSGLSYGIQLRKVAHEYSSIFIVKIQSQIGALLFLPIFFVTDLSTFLSIPITWEIFFTIFKLALFASCGAFILFTIAMRRLGLNNANIFSNLVPVFTAIISYFVLGELFSFSKIIGVFIVVIGLFISQIPFFLHVKKRKTNIMPVS